MVYRAVRNAFYSRRGLDPRPEAHEELILRDTEGAADQRHLRNAAETITEKIYSPDTPQRSGVQYTLFACVHHVGPRPNRTC